MQAVKELKVNINKQENKVNAQQELIDRGLLVVVDPRGCQCDCFYYPELCLLHAKGVH